MMSEHSEQVAVIQWKNMLQNRHIELGLLFAVPNGGLRNRMVAIKLKAEGVQPGVPDLILPVPKKGHTGLAIEMKVRPNKETHEQKWWLSSLENNGWVTAICYSADEAIRIICKYLGIKDAYA
jgi:hypothetical protein